MEKEQKRQAGVVRNGGGSSAKRVWVREKVVPTAPIRLLGFGKEKKDEQ